MRPPTLLILLCICATALGVTLFIDRQLTDLPTTSLPSDPAAQKYLAQLEDQILQLQTDNAALRNLLAADSTTEIDPSLTHFVEQDLHLSFRTPPLVFTRTEDILSDAAAQLWIAAFGDSGIQMRNYAFEVLGILPANQNLLGQLISADTLGAVGVYDHSAAEILLAAHFDPENIHHQAGLIRLLAIALLDQHQPLPNEHTDDEFFAHIALQRARASILQDRFYTINARQLGFVSKITDNQDGQNSDAADFLAALSPYLKTLITFPNLQAKDYLSKQLARNQSPNDTAKKPSPTSTKEILLTNTSTTSTTTTAAFIPTRGDNVQLSTQLGAITVLGYLRQTETPHEQIIALIKLYHGDKLTITSTNQSSTTEWQTLWDSPAAAKTFSTLARQVNTSLESPPKLHLKGRTVTLTFSEPSR